MTVARLSLPLVAAHRTDVAGVTGDVAPTDDAGLRGDAQVFADGAPCVVAALTGDRDADRIGEHGLQRHEFGEQFGVVVGDGPAERSDHACRRRYPLVNGVQLLGPFGSHEPAGISAGG